MELLVNLHTPTDPLHPHIGDVIVAMSDGHGWFANELANPDRVIIRAPIPTSHADMLTVPLYDQKDDMAALRAYHLDLEQVPEFVEARNDGKLDQIVMATRDSIEAATVSKVSAA